MPITLNQEILSYDLELIWKVAKLHKGIFTPELIESYKEGLALPISLVSLVAYFMAKANISSNDQIYCAALATALATQKQSAEAVLSSNRLALLATFSGIPKRSIPPIVLASLVLGFSAKEYDELFSAECDKLQKLEKIVARLKLPEQTLEHISPLVFSHLEECRDIIATEYANNLPLGLEKAIIHDLTVLSPYWQHDGLVIPQSVKPQVITEQAAQKLKAVKIFDPALL